MPLVNVTIVGTFTDYINFITGKVSRQTDRGRGKDRTLFQNVLHQGGIKLQ